jgi:major type 1 subunit fimbrin (pilin)
MNLKLASLTLAVLASAPLLANAASGTLDFTGEIIPTSCEVDVGDANVPVDFGRIDVAALTAGGQPAGHTSFDIVVECANNTDRVGVRFGAASHDSATGNIVPETGSAANVQIALFDQNGTKQPLNAAPTVWTPTQAGRMTLRYSAALQAVGGNAVPGPVTANGMFTVTHP